MTSRRGARRQVLGERRIGHAGTLDPAAAGVLPLLVGEATKLMPYLVDQDKEYRATIRLGLTTDTHDLEGRVVSTAPVPALRIEDVDRACRRFVGRIRQTPPMYSAVHHAGRRLYELAREGVEVAREAREIVVHTMEVLALDGDRVTVRVVCGKGTYVRALAADLGADLGCGGAVERLQRVRVGPSPGRRRCRPTICSAATGPRCGRACSRWTPRSRVAVGGLGDRDAARSSTDSRPPPWGKRWDPW
jgi:tRNA pseudouridine55 synthase